MTQRQSQVNLLSIHEFAAICRTTVRTVRFYDKSGLLKPRHIDEATKYRYYSPDQARDFFQIRLLQNFHIPLKKIPSTLKRKSAQSFIENKLWDVNNEIIEKQKEYIFLTKIKEFMYTKNPRKLMSVQTFGPHLLFCLRTEHHRYDQINASITRLRELIKKYNVLCEDIQMVFYWDPYDYVPHDTQLEVCFVCKKGYTPPPLDLPKNVYFKTFLKQKALTYEYQGPFEYLTFIHRTMLEMTRKYPYHGLPFDLHTKGPWNIESPYDFMSYVAYPVKK
jgi:DNA-binding transcriptional MerR regulator